MPTKSAKKAATKSVKKAATGSGKLSTADKDKLPEKTFAFPEKRKEPLEDAAHVRNALARFNQVEGVTDEERKEAFANIKKAAKKFGVEVNEKDWKELANKKVTGFSAFASVLHQPISAGWHAGEEHLCKQKADAV